MQKFTVTQNHITLLKNSYVGWCDDEFGAACIDPKRPYGNSDVYDDIQRILEIPDDSHPLMFYDSMHRQTRKALQIFLATGRMEVGEYVADDYCKNWRKV